MCKTSNTRLLLRLIIDFVIVIAVACVALIVLPKTLHTQQRGYFCNDETLKYPVRETKLNMVHITILVVAVPAAVILIVESLSAVFRAAIKPANANASTSENFTFGISIPNFIGECYKIIGVYLFGLGLTMITLRITQHHTGRLRPNFIEVCAPQLADGSLCNGTELFEGNSLYIQNYTCSEPPTDELLAVRHSFPSSFATLATYAMLFLVFYLQARLYAHRFVLLRFTVQFVCVMIAAVVSIERVYAFRNHWTDSLAGAGLGCIFSFFTTICILDLLRSGVRKRSYREVDGRRIYGYNTVVRNVTTYS